MKKLGAIFIAVLLLAQFTSCGGEKETPTYEEPNLKMTFEYDGNADYDGDGLLSDEELEAGTDMYAVDTDGDGLSDHDEIYNSHTDPLNADTDKDGLLDGMELWAGLDPLNQKSDGKTLDSKRTFSAEASRGEATITVEGDANIYDLYFEPVALSGLRQMPGIASEMVEIFLNHKYKTALLQFDYDREKIEQAGLLEEELCVFQMTNDGEFIPVDSTVDTQAQTVTAKLEHFSRYVLADSRIVNKAEGSQVMLLLDNSGSMYPKSVQEDSEENDVDFKRVDMANSLVDMLPDNVELGVAKFTATYTLLADIGADKETLHQKIDSIRVDDEEFNGTYIASSIQSALSSFDANDLTHRKFIVLLTDGATTEGSGLFGWLTNPYNEKDAIDECNAQNVTVITVGLGSSVDQEYLKKIAVQTGGIYLHANNANALEEIYNAIITQLNFGFVDLDGDGENDGFVFADSGFDPMRDGFSFPNTSLVTEHFEDPRTEGLCYGMAAMAQLYYTGNLELNGEGYSTQLGGLLVQRWANPPAYDLSGISFFADGKQSLYSYTDPILTTTAAIKQMDKLERYEFDASSNALLYAPDVREQIDAYQALGYYSSATSGVWETEGSYTSAEFLEWRLADMDPQYAEFYKALFWHFCLQGNDDLHTIKELANTNEGYEFLYESLENGIPLLLQIPGHAVNAISLISDLADPTRLILEVYDNNSPGQAQQYSIVRKQISRWARITNASNWGNGKDWSYTVYDNDGNTTSMEMVIVNG